MKKLEETKGITLVALVLTIIILLILSGIAISNLTNTGLFKKANEAVVRYKTSQLEEQMKLAKLETEIYDNKSIKDVLIGNGIITKEQSEEGIINIDNESILITNYEGLKELSNQSKNGDDFSNKYVFILNDIDCQATFNKETGELQEGENFEPIANFNGILDGNGYKIKNLYIKIETNDVALIANIKEKGTIKDLIIDNAYIEGNKNIGSIAGKNHGIISDCTSQNARIIGSGDIKGTVIGGICGFNFTNSKIANCINRSEVIAKYKLCGGICGYSLGGNISNCTNYGKITGNAQVGGIAGDSQGEQDNIVSVSNCINYGEINEKYNNEQNGEIGGIVGCNYKYSKIINCTNKANINGISTIIGGISGLNYYNINKSYNEGKIETTRNEIISTSKFLFLGGICGYSTGNIEECGNIGEIKSNYNTEDDSDGRFVGGICGTISANNTQNIFENIKIGKCYNYGTIDAYEFVGGITGRVSKNSNIEYCFNNGKIIGESVLGGISGDLVYSSKVLGCYNIGEVSGKSNYGAVCGAIYKTSQCKNSYYLNTSGINGAGYEEVTGLSDTIIGKSEEELKALSETLGDAYAQDNNINDGYPYLKENKLIKYK